MKGHILNLDLRTCSSTDFGMLVKLLLSLLIESLYCQLCPHFIKVL